MPGMALPDVQADRPDISVDLSRVGVSNVTKLVEVAREDKRPIVLLSTFNISVDLPSFRKGANLSRNFEAIDEVLEEAVNHPVYEVEDLCDEVAKRLLERHEYASRAEVEMEADYIIKRETPVTKRQSQETAKILVKADATRETIETEVGVELIGITVCPCAQGIMTDRAAEKLLDLDLDEEEVEEFLSEVPQAAHNQRGRGTLSIRMEGGRVVPIEKIIGIVEDSMSETVYELQKREDEAQIVLNSHRNPRFVEDCVRKMLQLTVERCPDLPDEAQVHAKQVNEESIHSHDAFAERRATIGALREEVR